MTRPVPTPDSYWVPFADLNWRPPASGRLLAGEYPGAPDFPEAQSKAKRFVDAGVDLFVDLTEVGEYGLRAYLADVEVSAAEQGRSVAHTRYAIPDMAVPTRAGMTAALDAIDTALAEGKTVYVHCFGGIGRTGTTVGCWLVRHGLSGEEALRRIRSWRQGTPDGWRESPETAAQRALVLSWGEGE